jgi:hypothetical protein
MCGSVDGGFLLTGFFQHWGQHVRPCLLIKTDQNGNELWRKQIDKFTPNVSDGRAIIQDSASKKIVIGGFQYVGWGTNTQDHILLCDSLGNKIGTKSYNANGVLDIMQTRDKKIVVVGVEIQKYDAVTDFSRGFAAAFDVNDFFNSIWYKTSGRFMYSNAFSSVNEFPDGSLLIGGWMDSTFGVTTRYDRVRFLKVKPNTGSVIWEKRFDYKLNGPNDHHKNGSLGVSITKDGGWVAAMGLYNYPESNPFFFVKYDSTGCDSTTEWCNRPLPPPPVDVGIRDHGKMLSFVIAPNPASDKAQISFQQTATEGEITITDVQGKCCYQKNIKTEEKISLQDFPPGLYFVKLRFKNGEQQVKKLVVER